MRTLKALSGLLMIIAMLFIVPLALVLAILSVMMGPLVCYREDKFFWELKEKDFEK
jgi:hypothetical protein